MGIYDREYYRGPRQSFLGSLSGSGQVCKWLIISNIVIFLIQVITFPRDNTFGIFTEALILNTTEVLHGQVWRLLTYAFLHSPLDIFHILFNMLFLWWFGKDLEEMYGSKEFLALYLTAAVLGGIVFTLNSVLTGDPGFCLGASGAVMCVMVLYACHFPNRIILFMFFIPMPIWLFAVIMVVLDTYGFIGALSNLNKNALQVAVTVHLAGAAFGFLYYKFHWRIASFGSFWKWPIFKRPRPRLRVYRDEVEHRDNYPEKSSGRNVDEQFEAKLDAVLEKIKNSGKESLTEKEREVLLHASEVFKQRRSSKEGV